MRTATHERYRFASRMKLSSQRADRVRGMDGSLGQSTCIHPCQPETMSAAHFMDTLLDKPIILADSLVSVNALCCGAFVRSCIAQASW